MKKFYVQFTIFVLTTILIACSSKDTILNAGNGELLLRLDKKTYSINSDDKITVIHQNICDEEIYVDMYSIEEKIGNKWGEERPWITLDGVAPKAKNETWQMKIHISAGRFGHIPGEYRIRVAYFNTFNDTLIKTKSAVSPSFEVNE